MLGSEKLLAAIRPASEIIIREKCKLNHLVTVE